MKPVSHCGVTRLKACRRRAAGGAGCWWLEVSGQRGTASANTRLTIDWHASCSVAGPAPTPTHPSTLSSRPRRTPTMHMTLVTTKGCRPSVSSCRSPPSAAMAAASRQASAGAQTRRPISAAFAELPWRCCGLRLGFKLLLHAAPSHALGLPAARLTPSPLHAASLAPLTLTQFITAFRSCQTLILCRCRTSAWQPLQHSFSC